MKSDHVGFRDSSSSDFSLLEIPVSRRKVNPLKSTESLNPAPSITVVLQDPSSGEMPRSTIHGRTELAQNLAARLIQVQETEKARIARELHDNVSQHIASLSISLSQLKMKVHDSKSIAEEEVARLQIKLSEIMNEIRNVSHELHPAILKHAGLSAAARSNCLEFSRQYGILVEFETNGEVDEVSKDISLCIYRILQESLHNIHVHANASKVNIHLTRSSSELELCVTDDGQGFDPNDVKKRAGLGFISMEERARMVKGQIRISTQKSSGTSLQVRIPV